MKENWCRIAKPIIAVLALAFQQSPDQVRSVLI